MAKRERKDYKYPRHRPMKKLKSGLYQIKELPKPDINGRKILSQQEFFDKYFVRTEDRTDMVRVLTIRQLLNKEDHQSYKFQTEFFNWMESNYLIKRWIVVKMGRYCGYFYRYLKLKQKLV